MALFEVDKETCTKCGTCAAICSAGIIYYKKGRYPRLLPGTAEVCLRCGHCVGICPTDSVIHQEIPQAKSQSIKKLPFVSFAECAQHIKSRRSVREFKDKDVPGNIIERIKIGRAHV